MSFSSSPSINFAGTNSGELIGEFNFIKSTTAFEDSLKIGRFAKWDSSQLDNFDGSATPVVAGVVLRNAANPVEDGSVYDTDITQHVDFIRQGLVTVEVKAGETPAFLDRVYISNDGDASDGLATATNTDVDANAEFISQISTSVWVIYITPAPGDVATHIADASAAHAASAISLLDSAALTAQTTVEAVIAELLLKSPIEITDPGDGGAIPVTRSGSVAITTTGVDDTRTLAIPTFEGQVLDISLDVDAGDAVITVAAAINQTGNNTITMADAGDHMRLVGVQVGGALIWRVIANDGGALTTV